MINGSVWVARFGAVICGICLFVFFLSLCLLFVMIISLLCSVGGCREFWCIWKREPQVYQSVRCNAGLQNRLAIYLYSLLRVFHAMFSEELVISLPCVFSRALSAMVPGPLSTAR
ncbi:hypothetical protein BDV30DRAFT_177981 [Aspergillus minisclerotigenes]|uniref:Uncharacterized protein n=1 Tax=Aspergillus minisclerotigenes TaxID=656917 RepID=A0A5N6IT65_9EURO|nr:hypothetical protein BDV30DRAFT_177981 [Aspergillus minisclerotigenes]